MRWQHLGILVAIISFVGPSRAAQTLDAARCTKLASTNNPLIQIVSATLAPAGAFNAAPGQLIRVPVSCRIIAVVRPTADSEIGFELWLPDGWNGRYAQLGNGGFAGNIDHPSLAAEVRRGNAAAMTDTGHKAGQFDASWALGHPDKVVDYGHRAIKVTADAARWLIADYYGRAPRRRYFIGCSNGGRQGLMAAQRYPDDWDGIIAGSPAVQWTKQLATFAAIQHRLRSDRANWIGPEKLPAIQRSALATCGKWALRCRIDTRQAALTPAQAATLDLIQSDPLGFDPRFAANPENWGQWILNPDRRTPSELLFATSAYRFLIHDDPRWGVEQFDAARDRPLASERRIGGERLADILDADNPDLSAFERRGGKLIMYVGTADALISPRGAVDYYNNVLRRMGTKRVQGFARLFIVRGMQHCQGGLAPNAFGQAWIAPALRADPRYDIRLALEAWVERNRAPRAIIAARYGGHGGVALAAARRIKAYVR